MTAPAEFRRADWRAVDVEKWNERLDEILGRRLGTADLSQLPEVDWAAEERRTRREWDIEKTRVLLSRLSERHRDAEPRHDMSWRWLDAYAAGRMVNLAIIGPGRVGKTWELAGILKHLLLDQRVPATLIEVPDLMDKLRPHPDTSADADMGYFQQVPVLGLDDLGAEKDSEWTMEQLYHVANYRNTRNLPTLVTTNLDQDELQARYGDRICGRLFEDAALLEILTAPPQVPTRFGAQL